MLAETAPADVPTMMGNGQSGRVNFRERLEHAHLVGGARAPPVRIRPARETLHRC